MTPDLTISEVQSLAMANFDDPQVVSIVFGGGAGGGKSFLIGLLAALACKKYPKSRWGLARKELKSLKQTTLTTLLGKVHPVLGITENDYKLNLLDSTLEYSNGSQLLLLDLTAKPSDPEMESLGSLELTGAFIDEVGEVSKKPFDILSSRTNRWMNKEYGITGKVVASCNPSPGFVRQDYFDKYDALGGGRIQKWQNGHVWVKGERVPAYNVYIRSTVLDNPFIDDNYVEHLKRMPTQEKKRLLDGDWNYLDEDDSLFPIALINKMTVYELPKKHFDEDGNEIDENGKPKKFNKFIGVDPSDKGKDDTVMTLIEDGIITDQLEIKSPPGADDAIGFFIAGKIIAFAKKHGFTEHLARNIILEENGIGASLRDAMRVMGWRINTYVATLQSRNDGYYEFMVNADEGKIRVLNSVIEKGELIRQLTAHRFDLDTGKPRVTKKKELRELLGRSPDHADSAMIANLGANKLKPKNISSYIRW
jgi:phage terminase large subunit